MSDRARRKELQAQYRQTHPEAGVYRIVNTRTGQALLGSSPNLPSVSAKLEFSRMTGTSGALDRRLRADVAQFGLEAFELEVLETLETRPEMTSAEIQRDLVALEELWREKFDPAQLY